MTHFANLLVVALSPEWQSFKASYRFEPISSQPPLYAFHDGKCALLQCGLGPNQAAQSVKAFFQKHTAERVLQMGTCGALDANFHFGDMVLVTALTNEENQAQKIAPMQAFEALGLKSGKLYTSKRALKSVEEKQRVKRDSGAHIVDMESFAVAQVCKEQNVSYACVRGVFDEADESLEMIGQPFKADGTLSYWRLARDMLKSPKLISVLPRFARRQSLLDKKFLPVLRHFLGFLMLPALLFLNNCSSCTSSKPAAPIQTQRDDALIPLETLSPVDERLLLYVNKAILDDTPALKPLHAALQKWVPEFDIVKARELPVAEILVGAMDWNGRFFSVGRATHGFDRDPREVETFAKKNGLDLTIETRSDLTYYIFPDDEGRALTDVSQGFFAYGDSEFLDAVRARHARAVDGGPLPEAENALLKIEIKGEVLGAKGVQIRLLPDATVALTAKFANPVTKAGAEAALTAMIKADPELQKFWSKGKDASNLTEIQRDWALSDLPFDAFKDILQNQVQNLISGQP